MKEEVLNYDIPDFSPDDDTEEMEGVPIYRPQPREDLQFDPSIFPKMPHELEKILEESQNAESC